MIHGKVTGRRRRAGPMTTLPKSFPKYLNLHKEPEQLTFDWGGREGESLHHSCTLSTMVCDHIATVAHHCYGLTSDPGYLRQLIFHHCSTDSTQSHWYDYVAGIASTMSFYPTSSEQTFVRSDRIALASDWERVQSDLNQVWHAITTAERSCNERSGQQRQRERETTAAG